MNKCKRCGKKKECTSFYIRKNGHPTAWCKKCVKKYGYPAENPKPYVRPDAPRCDACEIIIGPGYMEERFHKFGGKNLCKQCYDEAREMKRKGLLIKSLV
jgi:hypothetical protein